MENNNTFNTQLESLQLARNEAAARAETLAQQLGEQQEKYQQDILSLEQQIEQEKEQAG